MIKRGYKFRIYPNKEQEIQLKKTFGCCRYVYNWALNLKSESYKKNKVNVSRAETGRQLTQLKTRLESKWLQEVSSVALQQAVRNLEEAYSRFFKGLSRYPKFKKKKSGQSARFVGSGFSLKGGKFKINRIKSPIKVVWSRELPSKPSSCIVSQNPSGQWHVSFICETETRPHPKVDKFTGIDLGIESFATLSDGAKFKQPDSIRKIRRKLMRAQRNKDRKKKGSKNREKARTKLAKVHQKIVNIRTDFLQKLSTKIVRENQVIAIEDLAVERMIQKGNRKLARLIGEQGWYSFKRMLDYKTNWRGRELVLVDKYFPSSQICNSCGKTNKLTLDKRKFTCECGVTYDRDVNAAKNILAAGIVVTACGVNVRPVLNGQLTTKQEVLQ